MTSPEICYECGIGDISPKPGTKRTMHYRGIVVKIPDELEMRTCDVCCCTMMNSKEIKIFSKICEDQRLEYISSKENTNHEDEDHSKSQSSD